MCLPPQIWSGSSDGTIAVTDLDSSVKMDSNLARSLKTLSGKGIIADALCTAHVFVSAACWTYAKLIAFLQQLE